MCLIPFQNLSTKESIIDNNIFFPFFFYISSLSNELMIDLLLKKYLNNNLKTLAKIHNLSKEKGYAYYSEIEEYLNRGRNQISTIFSKLEKDNVIQREKDHRPQKIILTSIGKKLIQKIIDIVS